MNIILNKKQVELYNLYKIFRHMGHITHCLWIKAYAVDTKTYKGMINTKFWIIWGGKEKDTKGVSVFAYIIFY